MSPEMGKVPQKEDFAKKDHFLSQFTSSRSDYWYKNDTLLHVFAFL